MTAENYDPDDPAVGAAETLAPDVAPDQHRPRSEMTRSADLVSTLEGGIVPRLLLLSRSQLTACVPDGNCGDAMTPGDVEEWVRLLLAHGPEMADEFAEVLRHHGITHDRILLDLIQQATIQLAQRWKSRELDYPQLVQGLGALRTVVKRYQ